jgi:hypothetical protein
MKGIPFNLEKIGVDTSKVVEKIYKQYEDPYKAFLKEAIQNSWDARKDKKHAQGWGIKFYLFSDTSYRQTHLIIEDFGTTGMDDERWESFLSLWKPRKELWDVGGVGQGKFTLMNASEEETLIVESKNEKIGYRCQFLKGDEKSPKEQKFTIKDFAKWGYFSSPPDVLNHTGTKIWIYKIRKDFLDFFGSLEAKNSILETWWQILESRFNAKIIFFGKKSNYLNCRK